MTTKTVTYYRVGLANDPHSTFSPDGYSKGSRVYEYDETLKHIEELRNHIYNSKKIYANADFRIEVITEVTTTIVVPKTRKRK